MRPCLRVVAWVWNTGCTCYYVQVALLGLARQLCICTLLLLYWRNIAILNGKMLMIALSGSSENQKIKVNQLKFHALKLSQERLYLLHWVPRWANDLPHRTCIRLDARGLMDNDIITVKLDNYIIKVWKIENVLSAMQLTPQLATLKRLCFSIKLSTPDFHCKLFLPRKFWRALVCFVNSRNDPTRAPSRSLAGE